MSTQPNLFEAPPKLVTWHRKFTPLERFEKFHAAHPNVYRLICQRAREVKAKGFKKYSIRTLWEVMRWTSHLRTGEKPFAFDDHYPPFYARLISTQEADLKGFFEVRMR